jgi:Ca-activated chloride channel family protein
MKRSRPVLRFSPVPGILFTGLLFTALLSLQAQNERKVIRQGIKAYKQGDFGEAEVQFRKAGDINQESFEAAFNTGAALYGQKKYEETVKQFEPLVGRAEDPGSVAHVWHNIGNSLLESRQYAQSIEAYKNSLRLNPKDMDTKYNLAYAKKKLQDQQQQQQQNKDQQQQQKQDQQQQQQKQDQQQQQQKQDQQQQQQQNKDQQQQQKQDQQQQQQKQDQQQQQQKQNQQQQQQKQDQQQKQQQDQQPQPLQISKEDAQRMLEAIQQQEKDVKEKVDIKKAAVAKVKTEKDW